MKKTKITRKLSSVLRKLTALALLITTLFSVTLFPSASAAATLPEDGGIYTIEFKTSGMGLNVQYAPKTGIGNICLDSLSNLEGNEKWVFIYNSTYKAYYIRSYYRSDAALNALYGASASKGSQIKLHPSNINDTASLWYVETSGNYIRLKNVASGYYVDIDSGKTSAGTRVNLWSSSTANQQLRLNKTGSINNSVTIENGGIYTIAFKSSGMGLNVQYAPKTGIGNICLDSVSNLEGNEKWIFTYNETYKAYYIQSYYRPSAALNALYGASASKGSQVRLHDSNLNDTASLWKLETSGSYIRLKNVASGYYIDIDSGKTSAGTRVNLWTSSASNQQLKLTKVGTATPATSYAGKLLFPLKGSITRSSGVKTNGCYCDYKTGGEISLYAPADGKVELIQAYNPASGKLASYGNYIKFTSDPINGVTYTIIMAHLSSFEGYTGRIKDSLSYPCGTKNCAVTSESVGTFRVVQGQKIGTTGKTGNASGHHLHLEIKANGNAVNPASVCTTWN